MDFCPSQFAGVLAVAQDGDAVGEGGDFAEAVGDIDDGDAACAQLFNDGEERFGFRVERIDRARALVIDPGFEWGTYLGNSDLDRVNDITALSTGAVVVCGLTYSLGFPTVPGSYSTNMNGLSDAFLHKPCKKDLWVHLGRNSWEPCLT